MQNVFKELEKTIEDFAENIAKEIAEKRFYEIAEVKAIAKTRLFFAIKDCVKIQVNDLEEERVKMVEVYGRTHSNKARSEMGAKIATLNHRKKSLNRLLHSMSDYTEYEQLKTYLKNAGKNDLLKDFYDNCLDRDEFRINKQRLNTTS